MVSVGSRGLGVPREGPCLESFSIPSYVRFECFYRWGSLDLPPLTVKHVMYKDFKTILFYDENINFLYNKNK